MSHKAKVIARPPHRFNPFHAFPRDGGKDVEDNLTRTVLVALREVATEGLLPDFLERLHAQMVGGSETSLKRFGEIVDVARRSQLITISLLRNIAPSNVPRQLIVLSDQDAWTCGSRPAAASPAHRTTLWRESRIDGSIEFEEGLLIIESKLPREPPDAWQILRHLDGIKMLTPAERQEFISQDEEIKAAEARLFGFPATERKTHGKVLADQRHRRAQEWQARLLESGRIVQCSWAMIAEALKPYCPKCPLVRSAIEHLQFEGALGYWGVKPLVELTDAAADRFHEWSGLTSDSSMADLDDKNRQLARCARKSLNNHEILVLVNAVEAARLPIEELATKVHDAVLQRAGWTRSGGRTEKDKVRKGYDPMDMYVRWDAPPSVRKGLSACGLILGVDVTAHVVIGSTDVRAPSLYLAWHEQCSAPNLTVERSSVGPRAARQFSNLPAMRRTAETKLEEWCRSWSLRLQDMPPELPLLVHFHALGLRGLAPQWRLGTFADLSHARIMTVDEASRLFASPHPSEAFGGLFVFPTDAAEVDTGRDDRICSVRKPSVTLIVGPLGSEPGTPFETEDQIIDSARTLVTWIDSWPSLLRRATKRSNV